MTPEGLKQAKEQVYNLSLDLDKMGVSSKTLTGLFNKCFSTSSPK
jgi:hypothetical protein